MDSVKKEKHRFNFVDAIILIVVIAALALVGYIFFFRDSKGGSKVQIYYAVECAEVKEDIAYNLKPGELFTSSGYELGYAVDSVVGDREYIASTKDGNVVKTNIPGYRSVIFIVKADAVKKSYEYELDDYYKLQIGREVRLSSPSIAGKGYCIALSEIKTDEEAQAFINRVKTMAYKADVYSEEASENE